MKTTKSFFLFTVLGLALFLTGLFWTFQKDHNQAPQSSAKGKSSSALSDSKQNTATAAVIATSKEESNSKAQPQNSEWTPESFNPQETQQWSIVESVLKSKNDNDPRIDRDLKKLSPAIHRALFEKYDRLASEDRNGKGLVVFLVARDLTTNDDVQFLKKVYDETPCLSLADCKTVSPGDPHFSSAEQTTLVYPQLAGLYQVESQLRARPELLNDAASREGVVQVLVKAESFPVATVREKARAIRGEFKL